MSADNLLSRLDKVKQTGHGKWIACCPAHGDKSPSLSIRETDDGTILVHCFAGCSAVEIISAVGLQMSDLFPEKQTYLHRPSKRPKISAHDALHCLGLETATAYLAACRLASGGTLALDELERLKLAYQRISAAQEVVNAR